MSLVLKGILSAALSILQGPSLLSAVCLYLVAKKSAMFIFFFNREEVAFCHILLYSCTSSIVLYYIITISIITSLQYLQERKSVDHTVKGPKLC